MTVMQARGLRKTYETEGAPVRALRGLDLSIDDGEFVAIMGPSGCGKSTLLNLVAGLDVPTDGEIFVAGEALSGMDEDELALMRRRHIGIVFQFFNLLEGMTVLENATLPAVVAGLRRRQAESRARDLLDLLGLADKARAAPGLLSGGERQRLAIARALANAPTLLLADEPTGALDSEGGFEVLELFRRLHAGGQSILLVTHDEDVAAPASRLVHMRDGRVESDVEQHTPRVIEAEIDVSDRRVMDAPIVVSQLGVRRETAAPVARRQLVFGPGLLLAVAALAGAVAAPVVDHRGDLLTQIVRAVVVGCFALAGGSALALKPKERQPLLVLSATLFASAAVVSAALVEAHAHGTAVPGGLVTAARLVEPLALCILPVSTMHVLLGLPDGTCRLSRFAIGAGYLVAVGVGFGVWSDRPTLPLWPIGVELLVAVPIGLVGARRRYRRSAGLERQRMQWFGWAVSVGLELVVLAEALRLFWGWPTREALVVTVATVPIAVAVAAGALTSLAARIDRLLAWSVSVAGLTGVVVVVYLIVILGIGHTPTKAERTLLILSMIAAAVSALVYGPARTRLNTFANRVVYGEREAPDTVLRTFATRLTRAMPLEELLLQVVESLRKTLALSSAEIWTGSGGVLDTRCRYPMRRRSESCSPRVRSRSSPTPGFRATPGSRSGCRSSSRAAKVFLRVAPTTHSGRVLGLVVAHAQVRR